MLIIVFQLVTSWSWGQHELQGFVVSSQRQGSFNDHVLLLNFIVVLPHVPILSVACLHDLLHMCFHTFGVMQWRHFLPSSASSLLGAWQIFGWAHGPTVGNVTHNIFDCMTEHPHTLAKCSTINTHCCKNAHPQHDAPNFELRDRANNWAQMEATSQQFFTCGQKFEFALPQGFATCWALSSIFKSWIREAEQARFRFQHCELPENSLEWVCS